MKIMPLFAPANRRKFCLMHLHSIADPVQFFNVHPKEIVALQIRYTKVYIYIYIYIYNNTRYIYHTIYLQFIIASSFTIC